MSIYTHYYKEYPIKDDFKDDSDMYLFVEKVSKKYCPSLWAYGKVAYYKGVAYHSYIGRYLTSRPNIRRILYLYGGYEMNEIDSLIKKK